MNQQIPFPLPILIGLIIWTMIWKGLGMWRAGKLGQRNWFIGMLVINNDLGILEIVYLFKFATKPLTIKEIKSWFPSK